MAHSVFVCYASDDKTVADAVCAALESQGISCWIAPRDVLPGTDWGEAVLQGIDESSVVVLVLSAKANVSEYVKNEVERAVHGHKPLIPLRIEGVDPSGSLALHLSRWHWFDALTPPLEKHLKRLAETVRRLLEAREQGKRVDGVSRSGVVQAVKDEDRKALRHRLRRRVMAVAISAAVVSIIVAAVLVNHLRREADSVPIGPTRDDYFAAGNQHWRAGNYPEALNQFREILKTDSTDFEAQLSMAAVLREQGNLDQAIQEYGKAINLDRDDPRPHKQLGEIFEQKRELEKALHSYRECLRTLPAGSEFNEVSRRVRSMETELNLSLETSSLKAKLERMENTEPKPDPGLEKALEKEKLDRGIRAFDQQDFDQCIEQMEEVLALDPGNSTAQYFLAEAKKSEEDHLREQRVQSVLKAAEGSYQKADYQECVRQAEEVIQLDPDNAKGREYADSASTQIARGEINGIVGQYVESLTGGTLPAFLGARCSSELYQELKPGVETIYSQYYGLQSSVSGITIGFRGKDLAEVRFSIIAIGVAKEDGRRKALSEGALTWGMEKRGAGWKIVSWTYRAAER